VRVKITRVGGSRAVIIPDDLCQLMGIVDTSDMELDLESDLNGKVLTLRKAPGMGA
jgi:antitoxin component of MazEF toxin-antitoxin module